MIVCCYYFESRCSKHVLKSESGQPYIKCVGPGAKLTHHSHQEAKKGLMLGGTLYKPQRDYRNVFPTNQPTEEPTTAPTFKPTTAPTFNPTPVPSPAPLCSCAGSTDHQGAGGYCAKWYNDHKPWCFVSEDCSSGKRAVNGRLWMKCNAAMFGAQNGDRCRCSAKMARNRIGGSCVAWEGASQPWCYVSTGCASSHMSPFTSKRWRYCTARGADSKGANGAAAATPTNLPTLLPATRVPTAAPTTAAPTPALPTPYPIISGCQLLDVRGLLRSAPQGDRMGLYRLLPVITSFQRKVYKSANSNNYLYFYWQGHGAGGR
jgi:hypothetical protein